MYLRSWGRKGFFRQGKLTIKKMNAFKHIKI